MVSFLTEPFYYIQYSGRETIPYDAACVSLNCYWREYFMTQITFNVLVGGNFVIRVRPVKRLDIFNLFWGISQVQGNPALEIYPKTYKETN